MNTCLSSSAFLSTRSITWSNLVANRLRAVMMPPLGPSWYCFITCFEVEGSGFRVQGPGFRVQGLGFRV